MTQANAMENHDILEQLRKAFPKCWFKHGGEFGGTSAAAWSGEGSFIDTEYGDMAAFNSFSSYYEFGAHPLIDEFVEARGYHWQAYDAGTFLLYAN